MDGTRLKESYPDLARQVRLWDEPTRRRVVSAVCTAAAERAGLDDPGTRQALQEISRGETSRETLEKAGRAAQDLDDTAWDLEDATDDDEVPGVEYVQAFHRARAAAAIRAALEMSVDGDSSSLYEARHAFGSEEEYRRQIRAAL